MTKFRKKPVVIDAILNIGCASEIRDWIDQTKHTTGKLSSVLATVLAHTDGAVTVHTLEGTMRCDVGDWLIRGVNGELYPCKPGIFEATYERADEDAEYAEKVSAQYDPGEKIAGFDEKSRDFFDDVMGRFREEEMKTLRHERDYFRAAYHMARDQLFAIINLTPPSFQNKEGISRGW